MLMLIDCYREAIDTHRVIETALFGGMILPVVAAMDLCSMAEYPTPPTVCLNCRWISLDVLSAVWSSLTVVLFALRRQEMSGVTQLPSIRRAAVLHF